MSRDPPQRRRARARNGVAPYIPAAFCRDAGSAGHGATEAARPFRSLQARGFASGMEARQGGGSSAGSVHDSPPRQGDARESHKQERNGKKKRKKRKKNNNKHGNHRKITSEKKYSGHITNGKGNGRRVSVARFPSGRRQPARGARGLTGGLHRLSCITCVCCPEGCTDRPGKPPADSPQNRRFHQQSAQW